MKRIMRIITATVLFFGKAVAQSATEDSDGLSAVLLPIGNISFNSTKSNLRIGYVKAAPVIAPLLRKTSGSAPKRSNYTLDKWDSLRFANRLIIGAFLGGANDDGVASIFNDNRFTTGATFDALLGSRFNFSKENLFSTFRHYKKVSGTRKIQMVGLKSLNENIIIQLKSCVERLNSFAKNGCGWAQQVLPDFEEVLRNFDTYTAIPLGQMLSSLDNRLTHLTIADTNINVVRLHLADAITTTNQRIEHLETMVPGFKKQQDYIGKLRASGPYKPYVAVFGRYSYNKRDFKLYSGNTTSPDSLYVEKSFSGHRITGNINFYVPRLKVGDETFGSLVFGLSLGSQLADNYDTLEKIKIQKTVIIYSDSQRTDKKTDDVNAVKGNYIRYTQYPLMLELLWLLPGDDHKIAVGICPYYRYNWVKKEEAVLLSDNWKAGASLTIFKTDKANFSGGGYIEFGNAKEQNLKAKRTRDMLSIGLTTKINLVSFNLENLL